MTLSCFPPRPQDTGGTFESSLCGVEVMVTYSLYFEVQQKATAFQEFLFGEFAETLQFYMISFWIIITEEKTHCFIIQ